MFYGYVRFWSDQNWRKANNMRGTGVSGLVIKARKQGKTGKREF